MESGADGRGFFAVAWRYLKGVSSWDSFVSHRKLLSLVLEDANNYPIECL